ncbi:hypothetical protein [Cylindrospermum stagnale]|nr:hypothetical protein [Cylindrospermum stagnale]
MVCRIHNKKSAIAIHRCDRIIQADEIKSQISQLVLQTSSGLSSDIT